DLFYADLYRRTKVQESVFETLTQEYEMAKLAEVKEIPSVRVLDPAVLPEDRSFPPRFLTIFAGTCLSIASEIAWILGRARWQEIDDSHPRKLLAQEVLKTANAKMPWATPNGSRVQASM